MNVNGIGMVRLASVALSLSAAAPASAHHSFAMFDRGEGKEATITGVVKQFDLINPHGWLKIAVIDAKGQVAAWSFEAASVSQLARMGWKRDSVKLGDKVAVKFYPLKFGSYGGQLVSVVLPNGQTLGGLNEADRGFPKTAQER